MAQLQQRRWTRQTRRCPRCGSSGSGFRVVGFRVLGSKGLRVLGSHGVRGLEFRVLGITWPYTKSRALEFGGGFLHGPSMEASTIGHLGFWRLFQGSFIEGPTIGDLGFFFFFFGGGGGFRV